MNFLLKKNDRDKSTARGGFILPLAMLLMSLILLVSLGITSIIVRQAKFTRIVRDSFIAYNAADMAVTCTAFIDNSYVNPSTGYGIFPTSDATFSVADSQLEIDDTIARINVGRTARGIGTITLNDVSCGSVHVFSNAETGITYSTTTYTRSDLTTETGKRSTFILSLPLTNGEFRCAKVIFNKTPSFNQIIASGYSSCDATGIHRLERVIISSAESS